MTTNNSNTSRKNSVKKVPEKNLLSCTVQKPVTLKWLPWTSPVNSKREESEPNVLLWTTTNLKNLKMKEASIVLLPPVDKENTHQIALASCTPSRTQIFQATSSKTSNLLSSDLEIPLTSTLTKQLKTVMPHSKDLELQESLIPVMVMTNMTKNSKPNIMNGSPTSSVTLVFPNHQMFYYLQTTD